MALATSTDVVAALGRSLTSAESTSVAYALAAASDQVVGYLGREPDPVPAAVARVVADMVAGVFLKPSINMADYDASGYSTAREAAGVRVGVESATSTGAWLTKAVMIRLRPYRLGVRSVRLVSESDG